MEVSENQAQADTQKKLLLMGMKSTDTSFLPLQRTVNCMLITKCKAL